MKTTKWPAFLKQGDKVSLVSTARFANEEAIKEAIAFLQSWGLVVDVAENIYKPYFIFSGTDVERKKALQKALNDKESKAIICLRGGYGTHRIIDELNFSAFKKNPKWIVGYSDVTVLLNHVLQYKIPTIHGPMAFTLPKSEEQDAANGLKSLLFGSLPTYELKAHEANILGEAEGVLIGGNLSVLHALTGTASDVNFKNKILFIEEIDEYVYAMERMLLHLKRMKRLAGLKGIIVGHLTGIKDNDNPFDKSVHLMIHQMVKAYHIPVAFNMQAGHETPNFPLVLGVPIQLEVTKNNSTIRYV
jgi:muramoyltetrapeptide carboxypeptidase